MPNWLTTLASVAVRPRQTLRRILDLPRDRMIVPLVVLAALSISMRDLRLQAVPKLLESRGPLWVGIAAGAALFGVALVHLLFFYVLSWIAFGVSRFFEGTATIRETRSALAWGLAPIIWALLWRIPIALFAPVPAGGKTRVQFGTAQFSLDPGVLANSLKLAAALTVLELLLIAWYCAISSATLAEANRFSGGRGFATFVLTVISPLIVVAAAVIAWPKAG